MNWILSLLVSSLILGATLGLDPSMTELGLVDAGPLVRTALGFGMTLILFLPCYGLAHLLSAKLRWPGWTQLLIVAGMWFLVWLGFFLYDSKTSGLSSLRDVMKATGQFWISSLAYGIPWVVLGYWRASPRA